MLYFSLGIAFSNLDTGESLGKGFYVLDRLIEYRGGEHQFYKNYKDNLVVPPHIISYINTDDYLLVKSLHCQYVMGYDMEPDLVYPVHKYTMYYWYIDKNALSVYGPALYPELYSFFVEKDLAGHLPRKRVQP
ncbi:MAG: hypothetical protein IJS66_03175 [Bacteroidales bacterium]|nr:hypothetical protein [Bacteroidales bacterium]